MVEGISDHQLKTKIKELLSSAGEGSVIPSNDDIDTFTKEKDFIFMCNYVFSDIFSSQETFELLVSKLKKENILEENFLSFLIYLTFHTSTYSIELTDVFDPIYDITESDNILYDALNLSGNTFLGSIDDEKLSKNNAKVTIFISGKKREELAYSNRF